MTHISPRVTRDVATHYERMARAERRDQLLDLARSLTLWAALIATATLTGYCLGRADTTPPPGLAQTQSAQGW